MFTDLVPFQPWLSLFGGALIGLAAVLLLAIKGKIAGISGIVGGLLKPSSGDVGWRLAFIVGLLASPFLLSAAGFSLSKGEIDLDLGALLLGGLLVGFGTRLGSLLALCDGGSSRGQHGRHPTGDSSGQGPPSRQARSADSPGYHSLAADWIFPLWQRLGTGRLLSWSGARILRHAGNRSRAVLCRHDHRDVCTQPF